LEDIGFKLWYTSTIATKNGVDIMINKILKGQSGGHQEAIRHNYFSE
jgi:hypothetical protein